MIGKFASLDSESFPVDYLTQLITFLRN